jgi:hypothetical protein
MNCFPRSKESVNSINHIFSSISVLLCIPFWFPDWHLTWSISIQQVLWGMVEPCIQAHVRDTHSETVAVKSLVMSVLTVCVAAWKYLLIYVSSVIFNFLGFLLLVKHTFLFSLHVLPYFYMPYLLCCSLMLGCLEQSIYYLHENIQMGNQYMWKDIDFRLAATTCGEWSAVAEGGYKSKEEHQA